MIQKILKHKFQILLVALAIIGFAVIRNFEEFMFYDPLLSFFQRDYASQPLPEIIEWKLFLNLFWRYLLNTILSVFIIFVLFKNKGFVKLSTFLYIVFFVILMLLFVVVFYFLSDKVMALFYIRRFLIQPLFLLLFVPGFYFQQYDLKKLKA